jgi:hypothetical protein
MALVVAFLTNGFLVGFLWTRLFLAGAMRQADLGAFVARVQKVQKRLEEQPESDAQALSLVERQLDPDSRQQPVDPKALKEAIRAASPSVLVQIFYRAARLRAETWQDPAKKELMERTIAIFEGLIEADRKGRFHKNYGQLGFALKDAREPDWERAKQMLDKAIEIRGSWKEHGWTIYEFNRALCRMHLDPRTQSGAKSEPPVREAILSDLRPVAASDLRELLRKDPDIRTWMRVNDVALKDL